MRKSFVILFFGAVVAATAFCGLYFAGTIAPWEMMKSNAPELFWLKKEFRLSDAEFQRISELHRNYLPGCEEMCRRIGHKNMELQNLLATSSVMTPEIEKKVEEAAQLRGECQKKMLAHFYDVAKTMPSEEGKRYLAWVQRNTFLPDYGMGK